MWKFFRRWFGKPPTEALIPVEPRVYRVLSIDGGGIKGVFPASFLASLEQKTGKRIVDQFDLIAGTSSGGIIALGLALGYSAQEIFEMFLAFGPSVFTGNPFLRSIRMIHSSKYESTMLRGILEQFFGSKTLGQSSTHLVIPSLNIDNGEVYLYKTAHDPQHGTDQKTPVVDIAMATAAAPAYFPVHKTEAGESLVDGGLWANNPVGLAVTEAVAVLKWPQDSLRVLSLGCTTPKWVPTSGKLSLGLTYWGLKAVDIFLYAQSSSALGTARLFAGTKHVLRISPEVEHNRFVMDRISDIEELAGLGDKEAKEHLREIKKMFFP